MRLLLDTHVALWSITADARMPPPIASLVADPEHDVFVSVVSIWEIAIKHALERIGIGRMPIGGGQALQNFTAADFGILPVTARHAVAVDDLPRLHGDPFDRLLAAQAICEPLRLVTHDATLAAYSSASILF